jgi:hypothetical protein
MTPELRRCMDIIEKGIAANEKETDLTKRLAKNVTTVEENLRYVMYCMENDKSYPVDEKTELRYNKEYIPPFITKWVFYNKHLDLERHRRFSTPSKFKAFCEEELMNIQEFVEANKNFYQVYHSDDWDLERLFFNEQDFHRPSRLEIPFPFEKLNDGCMRASYLNAYEEYEKLLRKELVVELPPPDGTEGKNPKINATQTDFAELGYGLHFLKVWPGETLEEVIERMRALSGYELKNWSHLDQNIRNRDPEKSFLLRMSNILTDRGENLDEGKRARRRSRN